MATDFKQRLQDFLNQTLKEHFPENEIPLAELDTPNDKAHGDLATSVALKSAKIFKRPPIKIAEEFVGIIKNKIASTDSLKSYIDNVDIKAPGFINFYLSRTAVFDILETVLTQKEDFGRSSFGQGKKIQVEFVSANPTGPLSVAHGRQAAVGDALVNVLNFVGFRAAREYYVNDEGNQINILGRSIQYRATEVLGGKIDFPEECYQGEYIYDIAKDFIQDQRVENLQDLKQRPAQDFLRYGVDYLMAIIQKELDDFGVHFDHWSYQSQIASEQKTKEALDFLRSKGFLYEHEGAIWFRTTEFGDDKDRVLQKSDGSYTYFSPDIAYHKNKFERGFEEVVGILGPDHHGYIPRLKAAVQALGYSPDTLRVLIVQLATIYRNGKPVSMSTRRGQYISLREVMDEVGKDAARFFFLMRHISAHLEFDLELAKKQTAENPVFYIQYAHARIYSVFDKAKEAGLGFKVADFKLLKEVEEMDLIKKIGDLPQILIICRHQMDVFALLNYLLELATVFHKFYDQHKIIDKENFELSQERLALIEAARIVLANGLKLLGVTRPEKM
ncbi:MAG: arginine--tRNA ligase [Candidatus Omnitrophica bacterium]|nr:arginine--tRNA ligase [Candidatus Omnitrophota bacterium]